MVWVLVDFAKSLSKFFSNFVIPRHLHIYYVSLKGFWDSEVSRLPQKHVLSRTLTAWDSTSCLSQKHKLFKPRELRAKAVRSKSYDQNNVQYNSTIADLSLTDVVIYKIKGKVPFDFN
jgi:hypothetical protein